MNLRGAKIGTVFLIVFIDLVGFGMIIPILPLYAERFEPSALVLGVFMAAYSAMQFLAAPVLGKLSDRFGRRPILLISLTGSVAGYLLLAFAGSIELLILSRVIDGISGGNISTAQAVIADITPPEQRAKGMGIIGAAFGLGFITGPALGGLLAGIADWLPGVGAAAASLVALIMVTVFLPETRATDSKPRAPGHPLSSGNLMRSLARPGLGLAFGMTFLVIFAFAHFESTFAQFLSVRFTFDMRQVSFLFVYAGLLAALVQGMLVGRLVRRFSEEKLIVAGAGLAVAAAVSIPFSTKLAPLLAVLGVLALGHGLLSPSLSSLVSRLSDPADVGGALGIQQALSSLGRVFGPFLAQLAFGGIGAAWPYFTAAAAYGITIVFGLILLSHARFDTQNEPRIP